MLPLEATTVPLPIIVKELEAGTSMPHPEGAWPAPWDPKLLKVGHKPFSHCSNIKVTFPSIISAETPISEVCSTVMFLLIKYVPSVKCCPATNLSM